MTGGLHFLVCCNGHHQGLSMFANFMWLPYYPLWALVIIALDVAVVWAIANGD